MIIQVKNNSRLPSFFGNLDNLKIENNFHYVNLPIVWKTDA
ncbi:MAG: hypothetical protein OJF59_000898 [Cytophagales bacterium]|nr:MAG: hypothetical protein OJF59_000898 [Cytophagales bacterium]